MKDKEKIIRKMAIIINGRTEIDTMAYYKAFEKAKKIYDMLLPEDSVVLSREEQDKLYNKGFNDGKEFAEKFYKPLVRAKSSKETAEKILNDIMFCIDINDCNKNEMLILNLCKMLAKQFGVEIKE